MENYILRVYRREDRDENNILGLLENVEKGVLSPFHSFEELRRLLLVEAVDLDHKQNENSFVE